MEIKKLDASRIEKALYDFFAGKNIASFVYGGHRNPLEKSSDVVYFVAPNPVNDLNAYGETIVRIEIYVKSINGYKNASKLTEISDNIIDLMPSRLGDYYFEFMDEVTGRDKADYDFKIMSYWCRTL